jgi:hypothetical protein
MLSGLNSESVDRRLAALESKERQFNTDIIRLWQLYGNLVYKNQTNQPGGNFSPSSTSSPSSSPPPSSSPLPGCPDGIPCEFSVSNTTTCCCRFKWFGPSDGWQCVGATVHCNEPCYGGPVGCENCTNEPTEDGEYIGQLCSMPGEECPSSSSSSPGGGDVECDVECSFGWSPCFGEECGWVWDAGLEEWISTGCTFCTCQGMPGEPGLFDGDTRVGICCSED